MSVTQERAASDASLMARANMDRMYRWQRHIYDLTRKPYLLGRDQVIEQIAPPPGGRVLEIGCGTGRNLVAAARRWSDASFYGVDVSDEMLKAAQASLVRAQMTSRIQLAWADATTFDPQRTYNVEAFDRVMFCYTLSMIPDWHAALSRALDALAPGGVLLIADFGDQRQLPGAFRRALRTWLSWFHVTPRVEMEQVVRDMALARGCQCEFRVLYRGYAFLASISSSSRAVSP